MALVERVQTARAVENHGVAGVQAGHAHLPGARILVRNLDGATVLGCSPDSPEEHRKFIAKYKLKVKLLSDPSHGAPEKYGAWGEKNNCGKKSMGVIRSTVIIDPAGRVAHHYATVKAAGHAEQVRAKLAELQG